MNRGDKEVAKLLKTIADNPENAGIILDIIREKHWDYRWIVTELVHHKNFDTPEKCRAMENLISEAIWIGLDHHMNSYGYFVSEVCRMPIEGKERSGVNYKKVDTPEKVKMHENRMRVIRKAHEAVERKEKHPVTLSFIERVRKDIRKKYKRKGFEVPPRLRRLKKAA